MKNLLYVTLAFIICFILVYYLSAYVNDTLLIIIGTTILSLLAYFFRKWEKYSLNKNKKTD